MYSFNDVAIIICFWHCMTLCVDVPLDCDTTTTTTPVLALYDPFGVGVPLDCDIIIIIINRYMYVALLPEMD